jgi:hypothetical protein
MCVAPGSDIPISTEVFVTDIYSVDKADFTVDHDDLMVVSKIDLKSISKSMGGVERIDLLANFTRTSVFIWLS